MAEQGKHQDIELMLWGDFDLENATDAERASFAKAYRFSTLYHVDRLRKSRESFYRHDCRCAARALKAGFGLIVAIIMMIHEFIEDDGWTRRKIARIFGKLVAAVVDAISKRQKSNFHSRQARLDDHIARMRKIIPLYWHVAVAKVLDRYDNVTDTAALSDEDKLRLFDETEKFFLPLFYESTEFVPPEHHDFYVYIVQEIEFACDNFNQSQAW